MVVGESKDLDASHLTEVSHSLSHPFASQVARLSGLHFARVTEQTSFLGKLTVRSNPAGPWEEPEVIRA